MAQHMVGAVILETCRRGKHVNRIVMRDFRDPLGYVRKEEWHVCRFCNHERFHRTTKVIAERNYGERA
jgi:hypothetical protein